MLKAPTKLAAMKRFWFCTTSLAIMAWTGSAVAASENDTTSGDKTLRGAPAATHVALDAQALLTQYKCYICHADREAKAGPPYADVAAYYRGRPNAVSTIALDIRRGLRGGSTWHMPPHPEVTEAEARAMARYIMSLNR